MTTAAKPKLPGRRINRGTGHSYEIDGAWAPSITGIIRAIAGKNPYWPARHSANYAVDYWDELAEVKLSERRDRIEAAARDYTTARGTLGKLVHKLIEDLIAGQTVEVSDELRGYVDAWEQFDADWQPEALLVEQPVYHRTARYAGTPDLFARLNDGKLWLLDWKTGLKGLWPEIALQLAAARYAQFWVDAAGAEQPVPKADACAGIELRSDGTYDLKPIEATYEAFDIFLHAKVVHAFTQDGRDKWIGDALTPPGRRQDP